MSEGVLKKECLRQAGKTGEVANDSEVAEGKFKECPSDLGGGRPGVVGMEDAVSSAGMRWVG